MKIKLLSCMAVITFFFAQQLSAQDVSSVLRSKEKRQILYSSIINSDAMFFEFMESTNAAGRANDGMMALNKENAEAARLVTTPETGIPVNQAVVEQMVSLLKEIAAVNPEFQKLVEEKYPELGRVMEEEKRKL